MSEQILSSALDSACILLQKRGFMLDKSWQDIRRELLLVAALYPGAVESGTFCVDCGFINDVEDRECNCGRLRRRRALNVVSDIQPAT